MRVLISCFMGLRDLLLIQELLAQLFLGLETILTVKTGCFCTQGRVLNEFYAACPLGCRHRLVLICQSASGTGWKSSRALP